MVLGKKILTRDDLQRIEAQLERTDQEILRMVQDYGPRNMVEWGDGANLIRLIDFQKELVEQLAEEKRELARRERNGRGNI